MTEKLFLVGRIVLVGLLAYAFCWILAEGLTEMSKLFYQFGQAGF